MSELSQFYIDKARIELNEDENRKKQSIEQLRDWLAKHPFIKNFSGDDQTILMYLRHKKFSMPAVYQLIELVLPFIKSHPEWFSFTENQIEHSLKIINNGFSFIIPTRNAEGERVLIVKHKNFDAKTYNADDMFRTQSMILFSCIIDHESQISGSIFIHDCSNISFEYISLFGLGNILEIAKMTKNFPVRLKKLFIVGLPSFATMLVNQFIRALSAKLQNRVGFLQNGQELLQHLDKSLLLEEYGGNVTEAECKLEFERKFNQNLVRVKRFYNCYDIDFKNIHETDEVGSFRKLDID